MSGEYWQLNKASGWVSSLQCFLKSGIIERRVTRERARWHGGETNCCSSASLDVCAESSRPLQNLAIKLATDGLTSGYEFLVKNSVNDEKSTTWFGHGCDLTRFYGPPWLPLRRLLLSCRIITVNPWFITGYNTGGEVGSVSKFLFVFPTDRNAMDILFVAQQSWHKFRRNTSHVQIFGQNALNCTVCLYVLLSHKYCRLFEYDLQW